MYGYIYLTTNLVNGMLYVGKKTGAFNPKYLGSGKLVRRAVAKHGFESFTVQILAEAESKEELNTLEIDFIDKLKCVTDKRYYNLMPGGHGGLVPLDEKGKQKKHDKLSEKRKAFLSSEAGAKFRENHSKTMSGRKHSDEHNKKKGSPGAQNPNYGNKFGWSGANHPQAKPVEILMPDGEQHTFSYREEAMTWMKEDLGLSRGTCCNLFTSGEPYQTTHKSKKHLIGLTVRTITDRYQK